MGRFVRRAREPHPAVLPSGHPVAPPSPVERVSSDAGTMLTFASTMALLEAAGFTVARHRVIVADARTDEVGSAFSGRCVVKLADVPHRTELGAVRLGVLPVEMPRVIDELRDLAGRHGVPATVAIQEQVAGQGEVFVGVNGANEFGPLVLCGAGGVLVELMGGVQGALAPLTQRDVRSILAAFSANPVFRGYRGAKPMDPAAFAGVLAASNRLALGTRDWLRSIDVNPLIYDGERFVAVDGLCLCR
jgi:acyl-CoA synthetase (NDP forming)